jgi:tetratricopeptide (TPR) repeat protein
LRCEAAAQGQDETQIGQADKNWAELVRLVHDHGATCSAGLGYAYLSAHRYEEAIAQFQSLELNPDAGAIRAQLAWAYGAKRMYPQAIAEYGKISEPERTVTEENQTVTSGLGWVYAVAGRRVDALKLAKEFKELSSHTYVDPYNIAVIYAGLGDKDEAFRWLEKGYGQRSSGMPYLTTDPFWSEMRSDSRYADLLRRMASARPSD